MGLPGRWPFATSMYGAVETGSMSVVSQLIDSAVRMPGFLQDIAANDPVAAVLLGGGSLLIAVCVGALGYFGGGAAVEFFNPMST